MSSDPADIFDASLRNGDSALLRQAIQAGYELPEDLKAYRIILGQALLNTSIDYLRTLATCPGAYRHWTQLLLRAPGRAISADLFSNLLAETTICDTSIGLQDISLAAVHQLVRALLVAETWPKVRLLFDHFPGLLQTRHTGPVSVLGTVIASRLCPVQHRAWVLVLLVTEYGADPNAADGEVLRLALAEGDDELVLYLLEAGADPAVMGSGYGLYVRQPWGLLGTRSSIWSRVPGYAEAYPLALARCRASLGAAVGIELATYLAQAW